MGKRIAEALKRALKAVWALLSRDLAWKILSLLIAVLLWMYIVTSDPKITRDKTITDVDVTTSGLSVLQSRGLALLSDPETDIGDVRVRVTVPQSDYGRVDEDTVRVEMDLSMVRQTGRQDIALTGVTNYGEVVQITPSTVEIMVEPLDQRNVPVNVELIGEKADGYWYSVKSYNPSVMSISGPSSVVQNVASALVQFDVTGLTASESRASQYILRDKNSEEIAQQLTRSSSSITVNVDIYPTKQLTISTDVDTSVTGALAEGYRVTRIEVSPESITVAGAQALLDELTTVTFVPLNVRNRESSFSTTATLNVVDGVKNYSSKQVNVTVYIEEIDATLRYTNVAIALSGLSEGLAADLAETSVTVDATGPYSEMSTLMRVDLTATVDVSGLGEGTYELPVAVNTDAYSDLEFVTTPETVTVTLRKGA